MSFRTAIAAVAFAALPGLVSAQDVASTQETIIWSQPRPGAEVGAISVREYDALLAPVALYPDQLLSQILIAATYPLEVVEAARWIDRPENRGLTGDRLARALDTRDWDPSVKALAAFPEILRMMNEDLDWMNRMGEAFIADEGAVMDSVQRLRREARAAGKLLSDSRQRVVVEGDAIIIEPASIDTVYVPVYDSRLAYGIWPYPDYPPFYFPPSPRYVYTPWIGYSFVSVGPFWGWSRWDWGHRRIHITDIPRWRQHNRGRWHADNDVWRHDPEHRRGVGRGDRFRGRLDNNHPGVVINTPRTDRGSDWNRDIPNRNDGTPPRRARGPVLPGDNQANLGQPNLGQPNLGQPNLGGGNIGADRSDRRRRRPDVQLPDVSPPLPASQPVPVIASPVPTLPADTGRRERTDNMRRLREPGPDGGDTSRNDFRGRRNDAPRAAPSPFIPAQPPVMAQSQPGIAPMQRDVDRPRRFRGPQTMPDNQDGQNGGWPPRQRGDDGGGNIDGGGNGGGQRNYRGSRAD